MPPTPPSSRLSRLAPARRHHVPPGTHTFGMVLFLAALTMLFGASVLGYLLIRFSDQSPAPGRLEVPDLLWISTACLLASSFSMHRALVSVRHERQTRFRQSMRITCLLGAGFLLLQIPSLGNLLVHHQNAAVGPNGYGFYGLIFFLVLIHGAHLVGGLVPLGVTTYRAHRDRYDHEQHAAIRYLAMYWHFLDGVWLVMFAMFLLAA